MIYSASELGKVKRFHFRKAPSLLIFLSGPIYSCSTVCLWMSQRSYAPTSRGKKESESFSEFCPRPQTPDNTRRRARSPTCSRTLASSKHQLWLASILPTFSNLWNNTYCSPDTHLWLDPTLDSWRNTHPRPLPDINP